MEINRNSHVNLSNSLIGQLTKWPITIPIIWTTHTRARKKQKKKTKQNKKKKQKQKNNDETNEMKTVWYQVQNWM